MTESPWAEPGVRRLPSADEGAVPPFRLAPLSLYTFESIGHPSTIRMAASESVE
jgi:hypothetical protein